MVAQKPRRLAPDRGCPPIAPPRQGVQGRPRSRGNEAVIPAPRPLEPHHPGNAWLIEAPRTPPPPPRASFTNLADPRWTPTAPRIGSVHAPPPGGDLYAPERRPQVGQTLQQSTVGDCYFFAASSSPRCSSPDKAARPPHQEHEIVPRLCGARRREGVKNYQARPSSRPRAARLNGQGWTRDPAPPRPPPPTSCTCRSEPTPRHGYEEWPRRSSRRPTPTWHNSSRPSGSGGTAGPDAIFPGPSPGSPPLVIPRPGGSTKGGGHRCGRGKKTKKPPPPKPPPRSPAPTGPTTTAVKVTRHGRRLRPTSTRPLPRAWSGRPQGLIQPRNPWGPIVPPRSSRPSPAETPCRNVLYRILELSKFHHP